MLRRGGGRIMTILAVGLLLLDGILLLLAGAWMHSMTLGLVGAAMVLVAGFTAFYYRRHQRRLRDIAQGREELRRQIHSLRDLLRRGDGKE